MGLFDSLGDIFGGGSGGSSNGLFDSITGMFSKIPTSLASAGIFSAASLVSQMFGRNIDQETLDLARDKFNQDILNKQADLQFGREELASRERMAGMAAGATVKAAGISAAASKQIAHGRNLLEAGETRVSSLNKGSEMQAQSVKGRPEIILAGRNAQAQTAQATGMNGQQAFEALMQGVQGALRR